MIDHDKEMGAKTVSAENFSEKFLREKWWLLSCAAVTAVAVFLRFFLLELKPMHHDEGVNGHFLTTLFREGVYQYDPANYHGPDLYYISLAFSKLFGLNTFSVRTSVAVFGVLTVILAFYLRDYIGKIGSISAAMLIAVSPGMVYISRYFIHEILFVFFSLGFVVALLFFIEKRKAGFFATVWITLILFISFLPSALNLAAVYGSDNPGILWTLRIAIIILESVFIFFVVRMLIHWDGGRPVYLMLASASLVMLFATKETAFITIGTMLIACICVLLWQKLNSSQAFQDNGFPLRAGAQVFVFAAGGLLTYLYFDRVMSFYNWFYTVFASPDGPDQRFLFYAIVALVLVSIVGWVIYFLDSRGDRAVQKRIFVEPHWSAFRDAFGGRKNALIIFFAAVLVFAYLGALFFTSFFTYGEGVKKAFEAYAIWTKTGSKDHTQNGTIAYVKWMAQIESPLIILSVLGTLIAVIKARHRFAMFAGIWAFGLFLAYTIIPYKTPWLALSFTLPMCIAGGYAINELAVSKQIHQKFFAAALSVLALFILGYQTYDLNFVRYDSDRMPYVYAHSQRGFDDLINEIERYAKKSGKENRATIEIVSPDYWPMPWSLKDYSAANFHGKLVDVVATASKIIIASKTQLAELDEKYGAHYRYVGTYPLRPGVKLYLLVRNDLAGRSARSVSEIDETE
ncbi:MAG: TIGR03663 family protein [Pyrinomonadaceae bacterium]